MSSRCPLCGVRLDEDMGHSCFQQLEKMPQHLCPSVFQLPPCVNCTLLQARINELESAITGVCPHGRTIDGCHECFPNIMHQKVSAELRAVRAEARLSLAEKVVEKAKETMDAIRRQRGMGDAIDHLVAALTAYDAGKK